jgi:hypothetical protein
MNFTLIAVPKLLWKPWVGPTPMGSNGSNPVDAISEAGYVNFPLKMQTLICHTRKERDKVSYILRRWISPSGTAFASVQHIPNNRSIANLFPVFNRRHTD